MAQNIDSDGSDWFDKDEDEIVNDLKAKPKTAAEDDTFEYIAVAADVNNSLARATLSTATQTSKTVITPKLREITQMDPVDAFLYTSTLEFDFYKDQIVPNDSIERVILYVRILVIIAKLEMPGYYLSLVEAFVENENLLEHFLKISTKLAMKKYKSLWNDVHKVDEILYDIENLFWHSYQNNLLSKKGRSIIEEISRTLEKSDNSTIAQRNAFKSLVICLNRIISSVDKVGKSVESSEIYPTMEEIFSNNDDEIEKSLLTKSYENTTEYITAQKHLLREDFMISLRDCLKSIKNTKKCYPPTTLLFEDVYIILNEEFLEANLNQLIFVDILGSQRIDDNKKKMNKEMNSWLSNLKTGSLLCFSTNFDFDNLVLATVAHNERSKKMSGYISIEIMRQYNIGAIYNKKLLMFESPAFFEPYRNVFDAIKSYGTDEIPMEKYVLFDEKNIAIPSYLKENSTNTYNGYSFKPLTELPKKLPLNESQIQAYKSALTQEFCLIQGPPGTGKTHLSVEIVKTLITGAKTPIILITYTNESLDKFLLKLSKHTENIIRFGSQSKNKNLDKYNISHFVEVEQINPLVKRLYYMEKMSYKSSFEALQKLYQVFDGTEESYQLIVAAQRGLRERWIKVNTVRILFQYYYVKSKQIIAMTSTCGAKTNFLFKLLKSSIVIFEEAAEILESHVVACLTRYTEHVIMIGDHMQLQPYTSNFQHSRTYDMNISLFERLINRNLMNSMLSTQYRMRPEIAELICPIIYKNLENADVVSTYPQVKNMNKNLFFFNHDKEESNDELQISKYNEFECHKLITLVNRLLKNDYSSEDVVVLSPYAKQVELITNELHKKSNTRAVKVATVDSFQGMEADIILLSLVRSNATRDIGFLKEKNRICVALSRAKIGLYIIGNMRLLAQCSKTWQEIESRLIAQEAIGSAFPYT